MIKVETMKHENGEEGATVSVSGNVKDLLFEAMSALEGIRQLFDDREHAGEYKKIGCGILSGELDNDAWQDKVHDVIKEEFSGSGSAIIKLLNDKDFLKGFAEWLQAKIDDQEETLEC